MRLTDDQIRRCFRSLLPRDTGDADGLAAVEGLAVDVLHRLSTVPSVRADKVAEARARLAADARPDARTVACRVLEGSGRG